MAFQRRINTQRSSKIRLSDLKKMAFTVGSKSLMLVLRAYVLVGLFADNAVSNSFSYNPFFIFRMPVPGHIKAKKGSKVTPATNSKMPANKGSVILQGSKVTPVAEGMKLMKVLLRFCIFFSVMGSVMATGSHEQVEDHNSGAGQVTYLWDVGGPGVVALEFIVGFYVWFKGRGSLLHDKSVTGFFFFLHGPLQFLPLIVKYATVGWVDCQTGLWWPVHWVYTFVLVLSMPFLTLGARASAKVPFLGCKGSALAQLYLYVTTVLSASDQYLDSLTAAIALQCEWSLAWAMVATIFASVILQSLAAAYASHCVGGFWVFLGMPPECMVLSANPEGMKELHDSGGDDEDFMELIAEKLNVDLSKEVKERIADSRKKRTAEFKRIWATQGLAKLVTENVPQAWLAVKFSEEVKPSKMVYFSIAMSLILATKAFFEGMMYFCCAEGEDESDLEDEDEEGEDESYEEGGDESDESANLAAV